MGSPINIMLVDDSSIVRVVFRQLLSAEKDFNITCEASEGQMAIDRLGLLPADQKPHIIILDLEMPVMDGITAIPKLKALHPNSKIIVASTLSLKNAEISLKALELGAADYLPKPSSMRGSEALTDFSRELIEKVRALGKPLSSSGSTMFKSSSVAAVSPKEDSEATTLSSKRIVKPNAIAIASSTGGPDALHKLFEALQGEALGNLPIFITQHMPPLFTKLLAENITKYSGRPCHEASDGLKVQNGNVYLAAGNYHMIVKSLADQLTIHLTQDAPENFCRPAADPMIRSLTNIYGDKLLIVILTGMGSDGLKSCEAAYEKGATILAQDKNTSTVWGMPGAVAKAGICKKVLSILELPAAIKEICK